jgi:hypothetical protein
MTAWDQVGIGKLRVLIFLLVLVVLGAAYLWLARPWSYSIGERVGWVRTFSQKGSIWEGEMAMPSATAKFAFTVSDDAVAQQINMLMGRLVTLHYEQKVELLPSRFGDSRYYVTRVSIVEKTRLAPAVVVTVAPGAWATLEAWSRARFAEWWATTRTANACSESRALATIGGPT